MRVTVGISFHNAENTLRDAIKSVFSQTYQDWELILVDDGSTDGSLDVARSVKDSRVRVFSDRKNKGLAHRLNQIAKLARGEYLARMDADDLMHPERLERQVQYLDMNPTVDLVSTGTYTISAGNKPLGKRGLARVDFDPRAVLRRVLIVHPTVTGRTEWFRRHPYDESCPRAEDYELWCRTCGQSTFAQLAEPLHFYREDLSGNLRNYLKSCSTARKILRRYGPSVVGWPCTWKLVFRNYLKGEIYRVFTALRMQSLLIKARNEPLSEDERRIASEVLGAILETQVPGFDV